MSWSTPACWIDDAGDGIEYPIWFTVHGLPVLTGQGPLRELPDAARRHPAELTFTFIQQSLASAKR